MGGSSSIIVAYMNKYTYTHKENHFKNWQNLIIKAQDFWKENYTFIKRRTKNIWTNGKTCQMERLVII